MTTLRVRISRSANERLLLLEAELARLGGGERPKRASVVRALLVHQFGEFGGALSAADAAALRVSGPWRERVGLTIAPATRRHLVFLGEAIAPATGKKPRPGEVVRALLALPFPPADRVAILLRADMVRKGRRKGDVEGEGERRSLPAVQGADAARSRCSAKRLGELVVRRDGRQQERAAIVAWLRRKFGPGTGAVLASALERGEHLPARVVDGPARPSNPWAYASSERTAVVAWLRRAEVQNPGGVSRVEFAARVSHLVERGAHHELVPATGKEGLS